MNHLAMEPGELLAVLHLGKSEGGIQSTYEKARVRGSIDFPLAGAAVWIKQSNKKIDELRIALTAVSPYPHLVKGLEKFRGSELADDVLNEIAEMVQSQAKPMLTTTVKPWYRRRVIGAIARQLTKKLGNAK
jgi:4-hydroxybenzoyl-CoA reductase subunit beta